MLIRNLLILLCCCVYSAMTVSPFIDKGQRAEIFELTENKMPNLKVYMSEEEFLDLKSKSIYELIFGVSEFMPILVVMINAYVVKMKQINFKEAYPDYDINKILPELKIGEDGYPTYNEDEVLSGFDFNPDNYEDYWNADNITELVFESNKDFNLYHMLDVISTLKVSDSFNKEEVDVLFDMNKMFEVNENFNDEEFTLVTDDEIPTEELNSQDINTVDESRDFKTKNATMIFELDGEKQSFDKVTFKLGGKYSRFFSKPAYNIKIRGKKDLYGRSQFKLRADCNDPTIMRTKLISDIHNRLGLKSVSSTYVELYINDEFMGLYTLNDAYKLSWIEKVYGEKDATNLYKCESIFDLSTEYSNGCINENEEITDNSEWIDFLKTVENAKSASDLEDIFEIDHFLYEMTIDYLTGAWDHIQNTHNFYLYKQPNGKWIYLSHDFDHDFGQIGEDYLYSPITVTFHEIHLMKILIFDNPTRFEKILSEVIDKVFNPATLFPHIDEIKEYIKPYVVLDKTPDDNGNYPGKLNTGSNDSFTLEQWDAYSEFTNGRSERESYGLKYWTLMKYRYVCDYYHLECDSTYLDENFQYPVVEELNYDYKKNPKNNYFEDTTEIPFEIQTESPFEIVTEIPIITQTDSEVETTTALTETQTDSTIAFPTETPSETTQQLDDIESSDDETAFEINEPTSIDFNDESDSEEDNTIEINEPTSIDFNDESDSEEEENNDTTEINEPTSTNSKKTVTKTITMIYSTTTN